VTHVQVAEGVYRVTGGVVNWYVVVDRGKATLVDAGAPGDWKLLLTTLSSLGIALDDIDCVLLTHAHSDHTGFAEKARTDAGAVVRVHADDETSARTGKVGKNEGGTSGYLKILLRAEAYRTLFGLMRRGGLSIVPIKEVTVFGDGEMLEVPGRPRVLHVPGHTAGSCALLFEERSVLCTGDSLVTRDPFTGRHGPRTMPSVVNIDTAQAVRSLDHLRVAHADVVLPGHGDPWKQGVEAAVASAKNAAEGR
jgi:glyoxylase-like metal-dependent hydrolase (beta-lactamase superfamily II)